MKSVEVSVISRDAVRLPGTVLAPGDDAKQVALLVHGGGGVDRHEEGFYDRLSDILNGAGVASILFDNRAYLATLDTRLDVTIAGLANDISMYIVFARRQFPKARLHIIAASFGGGAAAMATAEAPAEVATLILMNPLLDYRSRLLMEKDFWRDGRLTDDAAAQLNSQGWLPHGSALRMTRALVNEVSRLSIETVLGQLPTPTLIFHGTADSRISHENSVRLSSYIASVSLSLVEGADHGFATASDEDYSDPRTIEWQGRVFREAKEHRR